LLMGKNKPLEFTADSTAAPAPRGPELDEQGLTFEFRSGTQISLAVQTHKAERVGPLWFHARLKRRCDQKREEQPKNAKARSS
jgi:hypothetical protein